MQSEQPARALPSRPLPDRPLPQPNGSSQVSSLKSPSLFSQGPTRVLPAVPSPFATLPPVIPPSAPPQPTEIPSQPAWQPPSVINAGFKKVPPPRPTSRPPGSSEPDNQTEVFVYQPTPQYSTPIPDVGQSQPVSDDRRSTWQGAESSSFDQTKQQDSNEPAKQAWRASYRPSVLGPFPGPIVTVAPVTPAETYQNSQQNLGLGGLSDPSANLSQPTAKPTPVLVDGKSLRNLFAGSSNQRKSNLVMNNSGRISPTNGESESESSSESSSRSSLSSRQLSFGNRVTSTASLSPLRDVPAWAELDREFSSLPVSRQSMNDIRASALKEMANITAERDSWRQEAERMRKELQNLKLQRLKDPSLLRPDMSAFITELQSNPNAMRQVTKLQKSVAFFLLKTKWKRLISDWRQHESSLAVRRRISVMKEIFDTEKQYLSSLYNMISHYKRSLDEAIEDGSLSSLKEEPETLRGWSTKLFGNVSEIMNVNTTLLAVLQEEWKRWPSRPALIGKKFNEMVSTLKVYSTYVNNYDSALQLYNQLMKKSVVKAIFDSVQKRPSMKNKSLEHHLIVPIQRLPRYELLFRELCKFTDAEHVDFQGTQASLASVVELTGWMNEERRRWDASSQVRKIMSKYSNCPDLLNLPASATIPIRTLVQKGKLGSGQKKRKYFLLTDHFLVTQPQTAGYVIDAVIELKTAQVSDANSGTSKEGATFTIWHVSPEHGVRTNHFECSSVDQKREIMSAISNQISILVGVVNDRTL